KDRQEALVRDSGAAQDVEWTIVRPGFLVDAPARGNYRVVEDMSGLTAGDITRADVGHFIVAALENNSFLGDTVLISE
ncbi:MAG: NAD(P)H-binding protein, partial [Halioglobus sp.]|nr:NAD(P)H-binding protein [Halioglobus sp.]